MKIDAIDKTILNLLQKNAKMNIREMENHLNLSKTPIYERIKRLEKQGIIKHYTALLNLEKLDYKMVVFCSVSLKSQHIDELQIFKSSIKNIPEITECYLMGGANDFLLKLIVKNLQHYHELSSGVLAAIPNVDQIKSQFVLNEVKNSSILPI